VTPATIVPAIQPDAAPVAIEAAVPPDPLPPDLPIPLLPSADFLSVPFENEPSDILAAVQLTTCPIEVFPVRDPPDPPDGSAVPQETCGDGGIVAADPLETASTPSVLEDDDGPLARIEDARDTEAA
jgi:hypothetical protein